jgi:hypothetical protein
MLSLFLLYICHQPPALLPTDKLDEIVSPLSSKSFYQVMYVSKRQAQQCSGFKRGNRKSKKISSGVGA